MDLHLDAVETRVLASLMEKDITTPEYYPLTLNALLAACNQKSSREPVMELEEAAVREALRLLEEKGLAGVARAEGRVARFEHRMGEVLNLGRRESALLCTLLLRGAQTPGELRGRSERLHRFEALEDVQSAIQKLMQREPPLARVLARQPGTKESRYAHLLAGDLWGEEAPAQVAAVSRHSEDAERIARLEEEMAELRRELSDIKDQMERFRKQFE